MNETTTESLLEYHFPRWDDLPDFDLYMDQVVFYVDQQLRPLYFNNEKIIAIYSEDVDLPYIYFVTKNGLGKLCEVKSTLKLSKDIGTIICGIKSKDDEVISIKLLNTDDKIEITTNKDKQGYTNIKATTTDKNVESQPVKVYVAKIDLKGTDTVEAGLDIKDITATV